MSQRLPTPMDPQTFNDLDPDQILPEQFFPDAEPNWTGELSLLWTVFTDGVDAFRREVLRGHEQSELYVETTEWILREDDESIFSFENQCDVFGLNPGWMRNWLFSWRERHRAVPVERRQAA